MHRQHLVNPFDLGCDRHPLATPVVVTPRGSHRHQNRTLWLNNSNRCVMYARRRCHRYRHQQVIEIHIGLEPGCSTFTLATSTAVIVTGPENNQTNGCHKYRDAVLARPRVFNLPLRPGARWHVRANHPHVPRRCPDWGRVHRSTMPSPSESGFFTLSPQGPLRGLSNVSRKPEEEARANLHSTIVEPTVYDLHLAANGSHSSGNHNIMQELKDQTPSCIREGPNSRART